MAEAGEIILGWIIILTMIGIVIRIIAAVFGGSRRGGGSSISSITRETKSAIDGRSRDYLDAVRKDTRK